MKGKCETCKWFFGFKPANAEGYCFLKPPVVAYSGKTASWESGWPLVRAIHFCSHHEDDPKAGAI